MRRRRNEEKSIPFSLVKIWVELIILILYIKVNSYPRYKEPISPRTRRSHTFCPSGCFYLWTTLKIPDRHCKEIDTFIYMWWDQKWPSKSKNTSETRIHRHGLVIPAHMEIHPSALQERSWLMEERVAYLFLISSFKGRAIPLSPFSWWKQ